MPAGPITYATLASVEGENSIFTALLAPGLLLNGTNVLAVEGIRTAP